MPIERITLTERRIEEAAPRSTRYNLWDTKVRGFGVRVRPSGAKSFFLTYYVGGDDRAITIAKTDEISLADARRTALGILQAVREGRDPMQERRDARNAPTVEEAVARFVDEFCTERVRIGRLAERTQREYAMQAARYVVPAIGRLRVHEVTRRDVETAVAALPPPTRNRVLAFLSRMFNVASREWGWLGDNPARGVSKAREEPRTRTLEPAEMERLGTALADLDEAKPAAVAAIRVATLTGLRISEVLGIQWSDLAMQTRSVLLRGTKTGTRRQPLPEPAAATIDALPRLGPHVFTTNGRVPCRYRYVRDVFARAAESAGLRDVRLHDLRRTLVSQAASTGLSALMVRDLLGHKTLAMSNRYVQRYGSAVADAAEASSQAMAAMLAGEKRGQVQHLGRRRA